MEKDVIRDRVLALVGSVVAVHFSGDRFSGKVSGVLADDSIPGALRFSVEPRFSLFDLVRFDLAAVKEVKVASRVIVFK